MRRSPLVRLAAHTHPHCLCKMASESIEMRTIGDFSLPAVGVGCWSFGSKEGEYWGNREQAKTNEIVAAALKHGPMTFFDTAEVSATHCACCCVCPPPPSVHTTPTRRCCFWPVLNLV